MPAAPAQPGGPGSGFTELDGMPGLGQAPGVRISGPLRRSQGSVPEWQERPERGAHAASGPALGATNGSSGHEPDELPRRHHDQPGTPAGAGPVPFGMPASSFDVFTPRQEPEVPDETPGPEIGRASCRERVSIDV